MICFLIWSSRYCFQVTSLLSDFFSFDSEESFWSGWIALRSALEAGSS